MSQTLLETTAIEYADRYGQTAFCYGEEDFTEKTLLAVVEESNLTRSAMDTTTLTLQGTTHTLTDLSGNLQQFGAVAEYLKATRLANKIVRYDFAAEYTINKTVVGGTTACVKLHALVSFRYEPDGELALLGDNYEVHFAVIDGAWCIVNVIAEEIEVNGLTKEEFDVETATAKFFESQQNMTAVENTEAVLIPEAVEEPVEQNVSGAIVNYRYYNRANAVAYAYTYTSPSNNATGSNNISSYLNSNFNDYSSAGGNCQNFVSQCVWAGLYGSNSPEHISAGDYPMDMEGSAARTWYYRNGGDRENWTGVYYFNTYIRQQKANPYTTGVNASIYEIPAYSSFASTELAASVLVGSVLHVNDLGHAIIITSASGTTYNTVKYSANSPMRQAVLLSDSPYYGNSAMELLVPHYFTIANDCAGHTYASYSTSIAPSGRGSICTSCGYQSLTVSGNLIAPIPEGTTKTISIAANMQCYRMAANIVTPSGLSYWQEYHTTSQGSWTYTFTESGLYTITLRARDISDSNTNSTTATHVFTVRVY